MEKLRNLLFYGGAMPDVYRNCRDEIRKENLEKLFFFLTVEIVFLLMALAVCCAVKSLAGGFIAYIIALACALVLLCTVQSCQNSNIVLSICADSFMGICYLLSSIWAALPTRMNRPSASMSLRWCCPCCSPARPSGTSCAR